MGCLLTKEAASPPTASTLGRRRRRDKERPAALVASGRKSQAALSRIDAAGEADDHVRTEDAERPDGHPLTRRRRKKLDPRSSNLPGHEKSEQLAAGWPSWLSNVAGEAIKGWTPRRADTFEKIDKASFHFFFFFASLVS